MNYRFNIDKAIEAAALFIEKAGRRINLLKLVKLLYILDRMSLDRRGIPVSGCKYYSMRIGPMTSEILDLINGDYWGIDASTGKWSEFIGERQNHSVELKAIPVPKHLSEWEREMIDELWNEHGTKNEWELVKWCHENCPEWTEVETSRAEISVEDICTRLGKAPNEIDYLQAEILTSNRLDEIFATPD
ncbi:MAG: Panacea domain-containing protein [Candidatus Hydrogenedentota bacterium]